MDGGRRAALEARLFLGPVFRVVGAVGEPPCSRHVGGAPTRKKGRHPQLYHEFFACHLREKKAMGSKTSSLQVGGIDRQCHAS